MSSLFITIRFPNKPAIASDPSLTFRGGSPTIPRLRVAAAASRIRWSLQCSSESPTTTTRRTANYKPPFWDFNFIQSLTTQYTEERYSRRVAELIVQVKMLLQQEILDGEFVPSLELIDELQRLCVSYHFEEEINQILNSIHSKMIFDEMDLYTTALAFRLLRDHGFPVSQDVFDIFKNEKGEFKCDDTRGVLQLYEASFLSTEGEETMELAKDFSTKFLQRKLVEDELMDENLLESVRYSLDLPIYWRVKRPNARCFIEAYEKRAQMNPIVLELAKLDFNIIQAMHQQELMQISRWWEQTKLAEKLPFARDRLVECYLWALGTYPIEQGNARMMATKTNIFITILDDIFDVYGTLDELQLFINAVQRWDLESMEALPEYMQLCFLTLNNYINEMAYDVLKEQGVLVIEHLRNAWKDLLVSEIQEARWLATGYTPTLDEYLRVGCISSTVPVILSHAFFLLANPIENEAVQSLYKFPDLIRCPSMILRLANDLKTSPNENERGEVADSVQCYMKENGVESREEGEEHVKTMIWETWKKMNGERVVAGDHHKFSKEFIAAAVNLCRTVQYMYQYGDGHGVQNLKITDRITSLLFQPIV